jgi:hypothetical protein
MDYISPGSAGSGSRTGTSGFSGASGGGSFTGGGIGSAGGIRKFKGISIVTLVSERCRHDAPGLTLLCENGSLAPGLTHLHAFPRLRRLLRNSISEVLADEYRVLCSNAQVSKKRVFPQTLPSSAMDPTHFL